MSGSNGWTPERRARQAEAIRRWQPWARSTGPRTAEGKAVSARNADKGGHRPRHRAQLRQLKVMGKASREMITLMRGAKWDEIDLKSKLWTVPADRMKVGKEHFVPLTDAAIDVLQRTRPFYAECSDLIFPGRNVLRPMSDMTLLKILRYAKLPFTVRGFRSSFRDWAAELTCYPGEVAEAALAHTVANKVEAAYRRTNYLDKRRDLMRDWAAFCTGKGGRN